MHLKIKSDFHCKKRTNAHHHVYKWYNSSIYIYVANPSSFTTIILCCNFGTVYTPYVPTILLVHAHGAKSQHLSLLCIALLQSQGHWDLTFVTLARAAKSDISSTSYVQPIMIIITCSSE